MVCILSCLRFCSPDTDDTYVSPCREFANVIGVRTRIVRFLADLAFGNNEAIYDIRVSASARIKQLACAPNSQSSSMSSAEIDKRVEGKMSEIDAFVRECREWRRAQYLLPDQHSRQVTSTSPDMGTIRSDSWVCMILPLSVRCHVACVCSVV